MWTVVEFINENAVEAVPSLWVKKDVCGWPKNNIKKHIQSRTILNKQGFDYFPSRTLKKGIASYLEAKLKAKKAEVTSDLSNNDEIQTKIRRKKVLVQDPPIFNELLNEGNLSKSANDYESLHNCQIMSSQIPVKRRLFDTTSYSQDFSDDFYGLRNSSQDDIPDSPDIFNSSTSLKHSSNTNGTMLQKSTVVHTTASPFKVTPMDSNQFEIIEVNQPLNKSSKMLDSGTSSFHGIIDKNKPTFNATQRESISDETLKKILSVVMKIKYDVENIGHNQTRIDNILTETIINMGSISSNSHENSNINDDNDYCLLLPLHNEDELNNFEEKLLNKSFRLNVVNGLKRLAKKSLTSTIRQMLRTVFDDEFLQTFSYVGQKKKRIFSSLASCAIIFDAIRKIKGFQDVSNSDIEAPIKIYLAGAAFRKKK